MQREGWVSGTCDVYSVCSAFNSLHACPKPLTHFLFLLLFSSSPLLSLCMCVQGDNEWEGNYGYISYFLVLLFWEVIPTFLIVLFFRVKLPCSCYCRRSVSVHTCMH